MNWPKITGRNWTVAFYGESEKAIIKNGSQNVAFVEYADDGESNLLTHANARFLAASSKMARALNSVYTSNLHTIGTSSEPPWMDDVKSALEAAGFTA